MNLKTIALVCSLAAVTAPFSVRADDAPATTAPTAPTAPATTPQPEGRRGGFRGLQGLTQEEQTKYRAALEAIRNDPKVQAAREKATAAFKESEETQNAAMIAADPSMEALIKKVQEAREKARAARGTPAQ